MLSALLLAALSLPVLAGPPGPCSEARFSPGSEDPWLVLRYTYDPSGRLVEVLRRFADGRSVSTRRVYDEQGRFEAEEDSDGGGLRVLRDAEGRPLRVVRHRSFEDGPALRLLRRDAGGRLLRVELDRDGDGQVDAEERVLYDEEGRPVQRRVVEADGSTSRLVRLFYDEEGRRSAMEVREGGSRTRWSFTYDEAGRLLRRESDAGALVIYDWSCWNGGPAEIPGAG